MKTKTKQPRTPSASNAEIPSNSPQIRLMLSAGLVCSARCVACLRALPWSAVLLKTLQQRGEVRLPSSSTVLAASSMRRCHQRGRSVVRRTWSFLHQQRHFSEYAPPPPSPSDLKSAMPEKFSVGKNLKLKGVLFEYDILAGSSSSGTALPGSGPQHAAEAKPRSAGFEPLTQSGENLIDEVTGILGKARAAAGLGGGNLQNMGKALVADLKAKMGAGGETAPEKATAAAAHSNTSSPPADKHSKQPVNAQDLDPRAKYMEKLRLKPGGQTMIDNVGKPVGKSPPPAGDASLLFAARERVSSADSAVPSAWMLKQGAGDLLLYLAARSVRVGVIAGPRTTPSDFERFVQQLRQQSVVVRAAISPAAMSVEGMEASIAQAGDELGGVGAGSEVLVVGSSDPILRAATAAKMFTARYHPPNTQRQGVIQTFVVRDIDEVRTVVEEVNGVSFR